MVIVSAPLIVAKCRPVVDRLCAVGRTVSLPPALWARTSWRRQPQRSLSKHLLNRSPTRRQYSKEMTGTKEVEVDSDFFASAMPKEEIGAMRFLNGHPEYDGRDVLVAIFDTGVDPGTKGLQITTDGRPKVVDVLDCTGSGDVDMHEVVEADEAGRIKGVNGRIMSVHPDWSNPSGEWHVGVRSGYELLPSGLTRMMKEKRLEKFQEKQREAVTSANKELADFNASHPTCTEEDDQKQKAELESRVQLLQTMMTNYKDPGPMIDCVVWYDGKHWRAALHTSDFYEEHEEKGRLSDFTPLTNFAIEHAYGTFSETNACNFACNIYDDGNLLSIVVDCGMHGTHVAGIASAYHPESPEFNGIAPGARLLICKIGDTRLGSMETSVGLVRAAIAAINWKVDVINLSYGECFTYPNSGRTLEVINDLVHKHGILFISAAGNNGPALSTVGAPGCCDGAISFGAYVSPGMAAAAHSIKERLKDGRQYTFSSRGPTVNGMLGVDLSAPGGAISNVPQWCGRSRMLANGTSMASPSGCGGVTLLLSGLKQAGQKITPSRVRRAMINTAIVPSAMDYGAPHQLTYGHGLFQVDEAWAYLEKSADVDDTDIRFSVEVRRTDDSQGGRSYSVASGYPSYGNVSGIYIREPQDLNQKHSFFCTVTPILPEDADMLTEKLDFELKLRLESTSDWVTCPDALLLSHRSRSFEVDVDGTRLPSEVNYAEIRGYDVTAEWRGPLFRLPVTMLSARTTLSDPLNVDLGDFDFEAGKEVRKFVPVPYGATWAELTFTAGPLEGKKDYFSEARILVPGSRTDAFSFDSVLGLASGDHRTITFPVVDGRILEICVAQYWSSLGQSRLSIEVEFHGVRLLQGSQLTLDGAAGNIQLQMTAPLRREKIKPAFTLKSVHIPLRPTESTLIPMDSVRDALPDARVIHKLTLTYRLELQEGGKITPRLPMFNRQMYDCEVEGQMVQIFDSNKKLMVFSDVYPGSVTVKKGEFTLLAAIRHENTEILKKYEHMPLIVEKQLEKSIAVPVYKTFLESAKTGKTVNTSELYVGQVSTLVVGPLTESLPKDCVPGAVMQGTVSIGQCNRVSNAAPTRMTFSYVVPPNKKSNDVAKPPVEELSTLAKLSNAARDAKIKALESLGVKSESEVKEFEEAVSQLKSNYPGHLPLLTAVLKKYDGLDESLYPAKLNKMLALCEEIISCIDRVELACFLARKCPDESKEGKKRAKEATEEKDALILALEKQMTTAIKQQEAAEEMDFEEIKPIFDELKKWADPQESHLALMNSKFEAFYGRYAEAIKLLDVVINSEKKTPSQEIYEFKAECAENLGWHHWSRYEHKHMEINFPKRFAPF